ncbi:MAG TPA: hypothetical protein VGC42_32200 [Kofleriaceae bacterium]
MRSLLVAVLLVAACNSTPSTPKPTSGAPAPSAPVPPTPPPAPVGGTTIALVYSGWEIWIGNDDVTPADDPVHYPGALKALKAGLDQADLAHTLPAGSQGLVITYTNKAVIRVPLGPVANLTSAALGTQKDYVDTKGSELVAGIQLAIDQLEKAQTSKKQLIVLSDGNDTNNEAAKPALALLKKRAAGLGISVDSIVYKSALSNDPNITTSLTAQSTTANSADLIAQALVHAIQHPGGS